MVAALEKEGHLEKCKRASFEVIYEKNEDNKNCIVLSSVDVSKLNIDVFVTSNTHKFFKSLFANDSNEGDSMSFLKIDPSCWLNEEKYLRAEEMVSKIVVVNDCAERAINLITRFNTNISNLESEKQLTLQVVEEHQKLYPYNIAKKDIIANMQKTK